MKENFKLYSVDVILDELSKALLDWSQGKPTFPPKITFSNVKDFFQKHVKKFQFEVHLPTKTFVGREKELKDLEKKLNERDSVAISQTVRISGLGGIGKTELAKQFIAKYKDRNYYGRAIWIDAENQSTIKLKINHIFNDLKLELPKNILALHENEIAKHQIRQIIKYFENMKVLFVFDNVGRRGKCIAKKNIEP